MEGKVVPVQSIKKCEGAEVQPHPFLILTLHGLEWITSPSVHFSSRENWSLCVSSAWLDTGKGKDFFFYRISKQDSSHVRPEVWSLYGLIHPGSYTEETQINYFDIHYVQVSSDYIIQDPPNRCIHTLTDGICVLFSKLNYHYNM
jgi:hypothetical protein